MYHDEGTSHHKGTDTVLSQRYHIKLVFTFNDFICFSSNVTSLLKNFLSAIFLINLII